MGGIGFGMIDCMPQPGADAVEFHHIAVRHSLLSGLPELHAALYRISQVLLGLDGSEHDALRGEADGNMAVP